MAEEKKETTTGKSLDEELKAQELEYNKLKLEDLRYSVQNERARREQIMRAHLAAQRSLDEANKQIMAEQSICRHHKGGKNKEGILKGHDNNYSIIVHTYPWGERTITCTRCSKEWRMPPFALKKKDAKAYAAQVEEYKQALQFPTDNEPSGTQCFLIERTRAA